MSDERDTRSVEVSAEVAGTPEEVWEAIATGPGLTAWFVPSEVDGRKGGTITTRHGPGMEVEGEIVAWEPPHRFAWTAGAWRPSEDAEAAEVATEILVEAKGSGTCVVRIVTSGFGSGAEWDDAIESARAGWTQCLENLSMYLRHFNGERCAPLVASGNASGSQESAWGEFRSALGIPDADAGDRIATSAPGAPPIAGTVERMTGGEVMLLTDEPAPGYAVMAAHLNGDIVHTRVQAYLFGDEAPGAVARAEPAWQAWMDEHFPLTRTP